jgi:hypothetical protein
MRSEGELKMKGEEYKIREWIMKNKVTIMFGQEEIG